MPTKTTAKKTATKKTTKAATKKLKQFDRATARTLSMEVEAALSAVGKRYGLNIKVSGGSFDAYQFSPKLQLKIADTGDGQSADQREFAIYAPMFGLAAKHFGATLKHRGKTYKIAGIRPKAHAYPIVAADATGRRVCFPAETAMNQLGVI